MATVAVSDPLTDLLAGAPVTAVPLAAPLIGVAILAHSARLAVAETLHGLRATWRGAWTGFVAVFGLRPDP